MGMAAGTRVGNYEILAPLGAGGMGEVYRARDCALKREVALKLLPEAVAQNALAVGRFRREAQLLAGLQHPNIAAVYGFEDRALAMELVTGETLAARLRRGALPVAEAVAVARQIAAALEYAHQRGIIHRDLKPGNIMLAAGSDAVKVLDFGLAKALAPELSEAELADSPTLSAAATLAGTILGTAAYMAPEQARGKEVDRRADIWAFGTVLYEMLSGRRAFQGEDTTDVLASVLRTEPDWGRLPEATPPPLRELTERCLRKEPRQRLQAMGEARVRLEDMAAHPNPAAARTPAAGGRGRGWAALAAAAGLAVGVGGGWWYGRRAPVLSAARFQAVATFAGVQRQPALSPDGRSIAFASNHDGSYNIYVGLIGGSGLLQLTHGTVLTAHPAWTPDGTQIAYAQLNPYGLWDLWEVAALGGTPRLLARDAADPAWSPDGQWLAYYRTSTGALWISRTSGEDARQLAPNLGGHDGDPRFSPDGRTIAFVAQQLGPYGTLQVVSVSGGAPRQLTPQLGAPLSPAWSAHGRYIYFACSRSGTLNIWRIPRSGGAMTQVTTGQGADAELDVSADGKRLVFATFIVSTHLAQLALAPAAGQPTLQVISTDPARRQLAPVYAPDGKRIVYFTNLNGVEQEQIWTSNADGSDATPVVADAFSNIYPRWTADGAHLLFATQFDPACGGTCIREAPAGGGPPVTIASHLHLVEFDVAGDGRLLYLDAGRQLTAYNPATRRARVLATLPASMQPAAARWAPDGQAVVFYVPPRQEGDAQAGLWWDDFQSPPRQVFRGWVFDFERGPQGRIFVIAGSPDMRAPIWTLDAHGNRLTKLGVTMPLTYNYWVAGDHPDHVSIAPDGRYLVFDYEDKQQADIGMLTFGGG